MRKPVFMTSQCKAAVLDRIVLIPTWFERSLHSARASEQSYP